MALTLYNGPNEPNQVRLELVDEKKTLLLRNEVIEYYKSCVEIGYEHYLIGLAWGTDSVIV